MISATISPCSLTALDILELTITLQHFLNKSQVENKDENENEIKEKEIGRQIDRKRERGRWGREGERELGATKHSYIT